MLRVPYIDLHSTPKLWSLSRIKTVLITLRWQSKLKLKNTVK